MTNELPRSWKSVKLAEITSKVGSGATPRGGSESYVAQGIPLIRSMNVRFEGFTTDGLAFLSAAQAKALDAVEVKSDDVLLNITGASIGRVTQAPASMNGARVNQHVCIIRPKPELDATFLARFLATAQVQRMIWTEQYGVTRQALTKGQVLNFDIPLPSLSEQQRIVAKLEILLGQVHACQHQLAKIPSLLKRFRQSVLATACSGRLTADWRDEHASEDVDQLVADLATERKESWERREAVKMKASGKSLSEDKWKRRYKSLFSPDNDFATNLPPTWSVTTVSQLAFLDVGFAFKSSGFSDRGIPLLRGENLEPGKLRWTDKRCWPKEKLQGWEHLLVEDGEIILALDRPLISTGLKIARATKDDLPCLLVQRMMRFKMVEPLMTGWLFYNLNVPAFIDHLSKGLTGSDLPHVTGSGVAEYTLGLPPLPEQQEIAQRVGHLFALADRIEARLALAQKRVDSITQAIFAKAFRGELVPTEAELASREGRSYEPASELLDRIRASVTRANNGASSKNGKKRPK